MKKLVQLTLGVMTALGGFVDIGELVFTSQAGARFGYSLLWAIAFGTVGIIVYSEMCGRIAAVKHKPVFEIVRDRLGKKTSGVVLVASNIVNLITCAAEIGGIAIVLQLMLGWNYGLLIVLGTLAIIALVWFLPFKWEERFFGLLGLFLVVFFFTMIKLTPDWSAIGRSMLPNIPPVHGYDATLYAYFVIGIISAVLMPYEVYFYSSGGIEENWKEEDTIENTVISAVGMTLGSLLAMSLLVIGAVLFLPRGIFPDVLGTVALSPALVYGKMGLALALLGILFCIGGSALETCLSGAYDTAQYFGWKWGRKYEAKTTPRFTASWIAMFLIAMGIVLTGIDPVKLVEYAVMFAVVVLPLTYWPVLKAANDRSFMGKHVNSWYQSALGWFYFVVVTICSLAAIPLMIATKLGQP
jgi:manganese transport protein